MNALSWVLVITVLWDVGRISVSSALKVRVGLLRPMYDKVKPVNEVGCSWNRQCTGLSNFGRKGTSV